MKKMKKSVLITISILSIFFVNCNSEKPSVEKVKGSDELNVVSLTSETFKTKVFNYEVNKEWKYEGKEPAIIDFYADWCAPCRQLSPLIDEIAKEYKGKLVVYKVDTEKEKALASSLGITGLPTLLFIPASGTPQVLMGLLPKEDLIRAVNEVLLIK
jgi:thioredoxin